MGFVSIIVRVTGHKHNEVDDPWPLIVRGNYGEPDSMRLVDARMFTEWLESAGGDPADFAKRVYKVAVERGKWEPAQFETDRMMCNLGEVNFSEFTGP